MSVVELDDKGRLTLPRRLRESFKMGKKVLVINAGDHIKVIPLPPDPLKTLHGAFNVRKPFRELRKQAESIAEKESKNKARGK
nr:division/cell wall cluster transcriptional repressor MraZ [Candidatus Njordarchaeota archaeon]